MTENTCKNKNIGWYGKTIEQVVSESPLDIELLRKDYPKKSIQEMYLDTDVWKNDLTLRPWLQPLIDKWVYEGSEPYYYSDKTTDEELHEIEVLLYANLFVNLPNNG